jgi:hypothetical protein
LGQQTFCKNIVKKTTFFAGLSNTCVRLAGSQMHIKYGYEIAKKVTLGLPLQKDSSLHAFFNKMHAFTKSHKMDVWACRFLSIVGQPAPQLDANFETL